MRLHSFHGIYMKATAYDDTTSSGTQPQKILKTMGMVDTSDLMMIIRWIINISSQSPELEWASLTHTNPHVVKKIRKVTKRINYIFRDSPIVWCFYAFFSTLPHFYVPSYAKKEKSGYLCLRYTLDRIYPTSIMHTSRIFPCMVQYKWVNLHNDDNERGQDA